jgi:thioredoxin 1
VRTRRVVAAGLALAVACSACSERPERRPGAVGVVVDSTFARDVLGAARPVVVYYWAHGCWPCVRLAPHVKRLAERNAATTDFWKLNMAWSAERTQRYRVRGIPTLVFYRDGREVARQIGMPEDSTDVVLQRFVDDALRAPAPQSEAGARAARAP